MTANETTVEKALERFSTPFYLFDETDLHDQIAHVKSFLPGKVKLCYAMKANPFIVGLACNDVARIEVCSTGEYRICEALGIPAEKVVLSGVSKDEDLVRELMANRTPLARYTVESVAQFDMLEALADETGCKVPLIIRLTSGNQFGVDKSEIPDLVKRCRGNDSLTFCGIQYFSGTQKTSVKRLARELKRLDEFAARISDECGTAVTEIEFGAGLPAEYFAESAEAALAEEDEVAAGLGELLGSMAFKGELVIELGRALTASCGTYATRIVDAKCNSGNNFAIVDGGMHQLVYYGHAMALQQPPCRIFPPRDGVEPLLWNICGSLCTTNDILAKQLPLADVKVGDVMLFEKAGAYCMTEGHAAFLSRDLPRIIFAYSDGEFEEMRGRIETFSLNTPHARG